jgi:Uma2 family endonuclease
MSSVGHARETLDDLYRTPGKAELIDGRIVHSMPTGRRPNRVGGNIYVSLRAFEGQLGRGEAYTDNAGFTVPELPSGRESFSPDASYHLGPFAGDAMRFIQGPPSFAVEVRSQSDHGPAAEAEMAAKRADYFAAGTRVVWDVDPEAERVHVYRADDPATPMTFRRGEVADAEPAVPGWRIAVDVVFAP